MRSPIASCTLAAAALLAASALATAQTPMGDAPFCLKSAAGPTSCIFQTMAACEQSKLAASADQCVEKSRVGGTTGAGGGMSPGGMDAPRGSGPNSMDRLPSPAR